VLWTLSVAQLSPKRAITTDNGWAWWRVGDIYVGWMAAAGDPHSKDLAAQQSFGVRASDGKVLWRAPGIVGCFFLTDGDPVAYRCTGRGRAVYIDATTPPTVTGMDLVLQGFDVRTGRTTWERHVGNAPSVFRVGDLTSADTYAGSVSIPIAGASPLAVRIPSRDLAPGEKRGELRITGGDAVSKSVGWCAEDKSWHSSVGLPTADGTIYDYQTHGLAHPCTRDGSPAEPPADMPHDAAAFVSGVLIWSLSDGMHAVRIPVADS
jgi:hypothetical protein